MHNILAVASDLYLVGYNNQNIRSTDVDNRTLLVGAANVKRSSLVHLLCGRS